MLTEFGAPMSGSRNLVAIRLADVVGYSQLAGADEDRTLARLGGLRSDLIDPAIAAHHSRIVKRGEGSVIEPDCKRAGTCTWVPHSFSLTGASLTPVTRRTVVFASVAAAVVTRSRAADAVRIGQIAALTGANAQSGHFLVNGAKLAVQTVNAAGGVLGKPLELITEDDQTTNPGAILAFNRLASRGDIVAFLGPASSTQTRAIAPDLMRVGAPMIIVGSDPALTHMGNRWVFRCRAHDGYSARVMAEFGLKELGKQRWAIVHSTDAFGSAAMKLLLKELDVRGVKPVLVEGYTNQTLDFSPIVLAVKQSGAEIIGSYFTFPTDVAAFARQLRQLGVTASWIGSQVIATRTALNLAGAALFETFGLTDFLPDANPEAAAFSALYEQTYNVPADFYAMIHFDGITVLAHAINAAGSSDAEAIRNALLSTRELKVVTGTLNFDANGDGMRGINIVRNDHGRLVFIKRLDFTE
jgi:branched-chain amino acid transport system substrate-binding protein